ncbi:MAG: hypothetical protein HXX16_00045 [Bacteroidales bacterium]|nr:hypothetical protein [Bacteroidales bacterium]
MDDVNKNRVLVCPLAWGLGHASRMIPIISKFQQSDFEVIAAGDELQMHYISTKFPNIKILHFPSFKVKLARGSNQLLPILRIASILPYHIIKEHYTIKKIVRDHQINIIISDNRYGLWCRGIKSIFITHQLRVLFPKPFRLLEPIGAWFVRLIIKKFTFCWIPDYNDDRNLSGNLSHPKSLPSNVRYIGLLSRFQGINVDVETHKWDLVGIASGPSPQREIFIDLMGKLSKRYNLKAIIIKGNPKEGTNIFEDKGIYYAGHLNDIDFANTVLSTKYLITRSGYSTIMDLAFLGISGLIIPTPGQTEQEYLAEYLSRKELFVTCKQLDIEKIDITIAQVSHKPINNSNKLFQNAFFELFDQYKCDFKN